MAVNGSKLRCLVSSNNYANDLLCIPIVLSLIIWIIRQFRTKKEITIPPFAIAIVVVYYSIYFEYYLPKTNPRYTADMVDVLLYIAGGFLFYFIEKQNFRKAKAN